MEPQKSMWGNVILGFCPVISQKSDATCQVFFKPISDLMHQMVCTARTPRQGADL